MIRKITHRGSIEAGREVWFAESAQSLDMPVIAYHGYVEPAPVCRVQVPSIRVSLIVGLGDPVNVAFGGSLNSASRVSSFAAALHEAPALVEPTGPQCGMQIQLAPTTAHRLLRMPMHLLAGRAVDLGELLGDDGSFLAEQLAELDTWLARCEHLDALIARRHSTDTVSPTGVEWALRILSKTHGRARIAAVAKELGWSRQHLVTKFREQVGLAPKMVARIFRFQHALELLGRAPGLLADVASSCGYADQAHFNREFRQFTGSTPVEFLGRRLPDGAGVVAA